MLQYFGIEPNMDFYKGVAFPDGRPAVAGFQRNPVESGLIREPRRWLTNTVKSVAGGYSQKEYENKDDEMFSWLSDLQLVMDQITETKKPVVVSCTYTQAQAYANSSATAMTREEIKALATKYAPQIQAALKVKMKPKGPNQ